MRYEYICDRCTEELEDDRPIEERDYETLCPSCGNPMRRAIGNKGGFRLKGSGWERDGYSDYVGDDKRWSKDRGYGGVPQEEV